MTDVNATDPDTNAWARFERCEVTFDEFCDLFEAECRDGALHDLSAPGTTHGPCAADGFPVPLTTTADVTLVRGEREWTDTRGTAWVSTNDEEGCAARFAGEHGWPTVLKAARGGYDGRGVWVVGDRDAAAAQRIVRPHLLKSK